MVDALKCTLFSVQVKLSSLAKSLAPSPRSHSTNRKASNSATSTPSATGATPRTTCRCVRGDVTRGFTNSERVYCALQAMWMMMQQKEPTDLVIATGETHSVREFVELAFAHIGVTLRCPTSCSSISECSTLPIFAIWLCEGSCKQQLPHSCHQVSF